MPWTVNPDHGYLERYTTAGSIGALTNIDVDTFTAPGTDPVMPNGSDNIVFTGAQVSSGTVGANVLRTHSLAASSVTYEIQQAGSSAAQDPTLNGVAHFNSSQFTVSNGFVSLSGGGQAVDSFTTDLNGPVSPDGNGNVAFTGSTNIFSSGSVANTMRLELQGTNHALFIGRGANTASISLSTGSSGQILQSSGTGSDPSWTTSTYPSTNEQGDLIYGSASNVFSTLAKDTNTTRYLSNTGTSNNPAWAQVVLTNGVTGVLPIANGGTNANTFATTDGTVYFDGTRLVTTATGSSGQVLTSNGPGIAPTYQTNAGGDVTGPGLSTNNALVRWDGTTGKLIKNGVITEDDNGNLSISAAVSGSSLSALVANTSNTASATAFYNAQVAGSTASDAYYKAEISGGQAWTFGLDNSASDGFAIAASSTLGTANILTSTTAGSVSIPLGDFDVTRSNSGATVASTISNTSNTASSNALQQIIVAGTSAGDAQVQYAVSGTTTWTEGIDNSDSDAFVLSASNTLGSANVIRASTAGEVNYPLQPAFLAYLDTGVSNVTGDGTIYTVIFDTEVYDQNADFNLGTSTFTAPVTGRYLLNFSVLVTGGTSIISSNARINTSNRTYNNTINLSPQSITSGSTNMTVVADMDATDTATFTVVAGDSGGKIDDVSGTTSGNLRTWVSGYLVA